MPCTDCFAYCPTPMTDRCVEYTGDDIPLLGICKGDALYELEAAIVEKLLAVMDGTGITFENISLKEDCEFIYNLLEDDDETLATILKAVIDGECSLKESIDSILAVINKPLSINAPCLTLPTAPTRDDVLAATAAKVCALNTTITAVSEDYVKASELCDSVQACLKAVNDGNTDTVVQEYTKMPKNAPTLYIGPMSVFDGSGKGIAASGYDKVYIMNGNNGTPDWRGYIGVGANTNVVGPTLDTAVDPSQAINAGYSMAPGAKKGTYAETLTTLQSAAHTHTATQPAHSHLLVGTGDNAALTSGSFITKSHSSGGNLGYGLEGSSGGASVGKSSDATPAITVSSTGGGQPHNNLPPVVAAVWIVYLP